MDTKEVLKELEGYGSEAIKNIYKKHGAKEPFFGVKVQDMKKIVKKVKKDHELSLELYNTGNTDAMYLGGLIADEKQISKSELQKWAENSYYSGTSEYTVAWVAAESRYGFELGIKWIDAEQETVASSGWSTLANLVSIKQDDELDIDVFSQLLDRVENEIHGERNRVRYTMNGFVIAIGCYIEELSDKAKTVAKHIGKVSVYMGETACKVPLAASYIDKVIDKGYLGKKRKQARC